MSTAIVIHASNPLRPSERTVLRMAGRIRDAAPKTDLPMICMAGGDYLLRADWDREMRPGEVVAFVTLPQGGRGGGSNILSTVAMIAVAIYAPQLATGLLGEGASALSLRFASAGIMFAGSALISALTPKPSLPSNLQQAAIAAPSPTYSLQGQGNYARLEQSIPVRYGRERIFPDLGAQPYAKYQSEDQFLHQVFVIGQGEYDISAIKIEDTPIGNFAEVTYEVVTPGNSVTLFDTNVVSSPEVAGQELLEPVSLVTQWGVAVVAVAAGSEADGIGIDIACPRGLFYAQDDGTLIDSTVTWTAQARTIDDFGNPTGSWTTLGTETLTAATTEILRRSYEYTVTAGRYEVRVGRTNAKDTSSRAGNDLNWIGVRATLTASGIGTTTCTLLAVKIRATNNISGTASRRINCVATRKLPTWSPSGGWTANTSTRSIAWAFADVIRNQVYGAGKPDSRVDLETLYTLDQLYTTRGDHFDGSFDNKSTVWEVLQKIARAGRAVPVMNWGIVTMVRDTQQTSPVALFGPRNIVEGSFAMTYLTETDDSPDGVVAEYRDSRIWSPLRVTAVASDGATAPSKPQKVQLFGITDENHALREAHHMAEENRRRRKQIQFDTEMEGLILEYGDLIGISHDLPPWGQSGEVLAVAEVGPITILTLSEAPDWTTATDHQIWLTRKNGSVSGPYTATPASETNQIEIADTVDFEINAGIDYERTRYAFGPTDAGYLAARVIGLKPISKTRVQVSAVNEDDRVHTADVAYFSAGSAPDVEVDTTTFYLASTTTNVNLFELAGSPAVAAAYQFVINSGVVVGGNAAPAIVTGTFPPGSTVTLVNYGSIVGYGGAGGDGQDESGDGVTADPGTDGGNAIRVDYPLTIANSGTIGGGGGGGTGGLMRNDYGTGAAGGGGGGGAGYQPGAGGAYTGYVSAIPGGYWLGTPGSAGGLSSGGTGGIGAQAYEPGMGTAVGTAGEAGGSLGQAGAGTDGGAGGYSLYSLTVDMAVTLTGNALLGSTLNITLS